MAEYKKQTVHILNNSELKEWIPDKNKRRLRLQVKLKGDLRRLGLSKRATRKGLIQLGSKSYVVLKRLPVSHFRKLQSSHSSNQNSLFRKEKSENKHRNDAEGQGVENLRDIPQQFDTQVPSAAVATVPINALDANETCQSKTQVYNLFETELLDGTVQDFTSKLTRKDSHIDVTSTNYEDISTERSDINAAPGSFSSEDESLRKYTQNFVEGAGASVNQKYLPSRNESSDTAVPIRLKKHHSDSGRSVAPTEDNDVFARKHNGKKKHKTEQQQKLSSVKAILTDTLQKCSNESRNNVLPKSNVSSSGDTIISESNLETDKLIDENEDAFTLKEHTQTHVNSALVEHIDKLLGQTSEKKNVNQIEINTESKSPQTDSPIEINSEAIIKRKLGSCSLDQTGSPIKIRKGNKVKMSSEDKIMTDNNIEKSDNEILSDNESARTKQKIWRNITQHIRKRERYKLLKQKRERHQESWYTKVKSIRDKMHEYFRGPFDPDTSESDEEHEIVCNYLKRRRLQSGDPLYDETTKEAKDIFKEDKKSHDISADNLQKGIESATSTKMKFDNLRNSVSIEKHVIYNTTTDEETEDEVSVRKHCMPDNSQESIKNINFGNSDSTDSACTEKYSWHDVTDEKTKDDASTCAHDTSPDNLQENVEKTIPVEVTFDNSCDSIVNTEKSVMYNAIDDEKVKNKTLICGTSVNSSQENINYAISAKVNSKNSCDSIANTEECYATSDIITDKKVEDRVSLCKYNALANNLQENVNSDVLARKQHVENFSSIVDTDNCSKSDGHAETSKNIIPSTIEMDLDQNMSIENIHSNDNLKKKVDNTSAKIDKKNIILTRWQGDQEVCNAQNVDLAQCKSTQNCATSIWKLTIMSAHESTWHEVDENDIRDTSQTVSNLLFTSNNNIVRDEKTVDQFSMILSTLKENSLKKKHDESLSVQTKNSSLSNLNCRDNNDLLQNSNSKDDSSDIEVEIKITSKLKSQMSRKYSLKAPSSAVNTCIKDLHKLQDNPNVLDELLKMDKTSERYKCKSTSRNVENDTLLDDNENVPVETEGCDITCDSSSTAKDNVNGSPQQRNLQDDLILDKNSNAMDHSQKGRDELSESVDPITTEDSSESNKLACDKSNLAEASTDDKRKTNEEQNSNNRTLEKVGSVAEHSREKENHGVSSIAQKKIQMATENSSEKTAKAAYNGPNIEEPRTSANATHSIRVRSFEELSSRIIEKSTNLNVSVPSKSTRSEFCQLESFQSVSPQLASPQSVPLQSTPLQSAPLQLTQPQLKHSQPIYQSVPSQLISQSTRPQLVALQSGSTQSVPVQLVPFQPIRPQLAPPQSGLSRSAPLQSAPQPTHPQLVSSQLTPQSVPIRLPTFAANTAVRHMHYSSRTNAPITPVTLSESNTAIINDSIKLRILTAVKNICADIEYCRSLRQYKHVKNVPPECLQKMYVNIRQIYQCLTNLMQWLHMGNVEHVLNYVNQYNFLNQPITSAEINNYVALLQTYKFGITQEQNSAKSNVSLHSNIGQSVPNVSMPSVNAQPLSRGAPFQDAIMPNYGNFTQSSTIPRPVAIIPNVNQQQLFGNSVNSQQAPHFRQPMPNIRQQYNTSYASAAHPRMPNVNQQQFLKNASHPLQGQYVQLANVLNGGIQQVSVNTCNVSPSNTNLVSVNQRNTNVSPATNTRQSHATLRNTTNNITTARFTANAQQQKPMYFQKLQANSEITIRAVPATANKNISPGIHQNSVMSGFSMANSNTQRPGDAMGNAERGSANQRQMSYNQQVSQSSTEKAQYTRYLNPNEIYPVVPQLMQCNVQKHSLQNTQPDQTVQQTLQQNLQESQHLIQPKDRSVCIIDLTTDNVSQNMAQNMSQNKPNKKAKFSELQYVQQKTSSTNPQQDACRETLSVSPRDISHNISGTAPRTFTSQNANVSQNTVSEISSQKNYSVLLSLLNSTLYSFNLAILTDIQKILLRNQLRLYFSMNQQRYGLSERESKQLHHERSVLRCLYQNLCNYINNMIKQSQSTEKSSESVREDLQGTTSQNKSVLQENMIQQTSVGKLTKTQTSQNNEINSECNTNSPMVVERNLEAPNKEVFFTSELITVSESSVTRTKEPLTKDTRLQEQSNDALKKKFQKSLLLEKRPNNTKVLSPRHSRTLEENSIIDVPAKN
ncbi:PREDICTED: uncharacterized protein LOC105558349, partial [Vollenhovia emeryi]|uniref:uncharacterized protein LOC105558349 n=1 Tax=Vollenhovia emeryi TaxID=411798 RepID=UPI0005F3B290